MSAAVQVCAIDVAHYLVAKAQASGEIISNMKLQKLLYYAYAWFLTIKNQRLFPEAVKAWKHGPVVPVVYHAYAQYGSGPITEANEVPDFDGEIKEHLDGIWDEFGTESALTLMRMTHSESPWIEAWEKRSDASPSVPISDNSIVEYFGSLAE